MQGAVNGLHLCLNVSISEFLEFEDMYYGVTKWLTSGKLINRVWNHSKLWWHHIWLWDMCVCWIIQCQGSRCRDQEGLPL